jgi:hypothetical protein
MSDYYKEYIEACWTKTCERQKQALDELCATRWYEYLFMPWRWYNRWLRFVVLCENERFFFGVLNGCSDFDKHEK